MSGVSGTKRVMLLGSGRVSAPLIEYFAKKQGISITIASNQQQEAEELANGHANVQCKPLDIADSQSLCNLIQQSDVVISFVPAPLHPVIAE